MILLGQSLGWKHKAKYKEIVFLQIQGKQWNKSHFRLYRIMCAGEGFVITRDEHHGFRTSCGYKQKVLHSVNHVYGVYGSETNSLSRAWSQKVVSTIWMKSCGMFWVNCSIFSCQFYFGEYTSEEPLHRLNFRGNCSCGTVLNLCPQRILVENENAANTVKSILHSSSQRTVLFHMAGILSTLFRLRMI